MVFLWETCCSPLLRKFMFRIREECWEDVFHSLVPRLPCLHSADILALALTCWQISWRAPKKIWYNLREKRCRTWPRSVLGEDISILIITFTSDWLTVRQIKKVHLASINYIYLRLSLHEISALAKKISVIKSRARRMNTFLRQNDIS